MSELSARPVFPPEDFTFLRGGHGAGKLSSSAVAPIVALARGYETVVPEEMKDVALRLGFGTLTTKGGLQLKRSVGSTDCMTVPWFAMDEVGSTTAERRANLAPTTLQLRPANPKPDPETGKSRKYDNIAGVPLVIDMHPSVPLEWVRSAPQVLFIEGCIKGDAVLSNVLRAAGVPDRDLQVGPAETTAQARDRLAVMLSEVDPTEQVLVVSFVGVTTWKHHVEWTYMTFADKDVRVAFDADVSVNPNVWNQAYDLMSYLGAPARRARDVRLIDLSSASPEAAALKIGVDDFLADYGSLEDVESFLIDLPESPAPKSEAPEGTWAVRDDGTQVDEMALDATAPKDPNRPRALHWVERVPIGGRVLSVDTLRAPTDREMETGVLDRDANDTSVSNAEVEISWRNPRTKARETGKAWGPVTFLQFPPGKWTDKKAELSPGVALHPAWPPQGRGGEGENWLSAVKEFRAEDVEFRNRWLSMGWVPGADGQPFFLAGQQRVDATGIHQAGGEAGVDDEVLDGASRFGFVLPEPGVDWREQFLTDLAEVKEALCGGTGITSVPIGATVMAMMLRPALPLRSQVTVYITGEKGAGKSFIASFAQCGWQARPGTWSEKNLPGAAKDSMPSMEHVLSVVPYWTADDLAPSIDKRKAESEESKISDITRSVHNGSGRRLMNGDGTSRRTKTPRALLVITAENELSVPSAADRVIPIHVRRGTLSRDSAGTEPLRAMRDEIGTFSRLTGAFIRWIAEYGQQHPEKWAGLVYDLREHHRREMVEIAQQVLTGSLGVGGAARHASMAADLMLTYRMLEFAARDLGADDDLVEAFTADGLMRQVAEQVGESYRAQRASTLGRTMLTTLRRLMQSKRAHVASVNSPLPPTAGHTEATTLNGLLGWQPDRGAEIYVPRGPQIGYCLDVKTSDGESHLVLLMDPEVAFAEAQKAFPNLLQGGQKQKQAWMSLWEEGLAFEKWERRSNGSTRASTVRATENKTPISGVPILLETLLEDGEVIWDPDAPNGKGGKGLVVDNPRATDERNAA